MTAALGVVEHKRSLIGARDVADFSNALQVLALFYEPIDFWLAFYLVTAMTSHDHCACADSLLLRPSSRADVVFKQQEKTF
jgi:hypothetical protein